MKAVILAGGKSTRTFPLTCTRPKPILPAYDNTILGHLLDVLSDMKQVDEAIIVVNYLKDMVMGRFGDEYKGLPVKYVDQGGALGTGHAVLVAEPYFNKDDESFLILNADDIFAKDDIRELVRGYPRILVKEVNETSQFGIFEYREKEGKRIATGFEEKPSNPKSNLASVGCYHFGCEVFSYLKKLRPSQSGEILLPDVLKRYVDWKDIELTTANGFWLPTGFPWDLLNTNEFLMQRDDGGYEQVIDDSVRMKSGSEIRGFCIIGKDVSIGSDCLIENSIILDGTSIGSGCEIRDSVIGQDVKIEKDVKVISESSEPITSIVKGKEVKVTRKRFGVAVGDGTRISKKATIQPGVKIWPEVTITNKINLENDVYE